VEQSEANLGRVPIIIGIEGSPKWDHTVENLCDKQGFFCGAKRSKSWTSPDNHRDILSPDNHRDRREPQVGPPVK